VIGIGGGIGRGGYKGGGGRGMDSPMRGGRTGGKY